MDCCCCFKVSPDEQKRSSFLEIFFHKFYAPFLMNDLVRLTVVRNNYLSVIDGFSNPMQLLVFKSIELQMFGLSGQ